ncbi:hypothetical protein QO034_16570 [Sedimentitalea sp. JM2-8]|uniref:Uncharacterized protein n=1 Tax=Sedimentitalea xiamensis TaxID=3050037 RepID=A0ABT7FHV7_9RHOB|nr:hypothetical protein [Sedimentitalea xiamensis]MDK3074707.1 hypothetical protein [Sedimentitalea xiamensis]
MPDPILADSATRLGPDAIGKVAVTGSHGGIYAAFLVRQAGARAAIFHDAGVGLEQAGIGGLRWLEAQGMAAAAVNHATADIGNAGMMMARGILSHVNAGAAAAGLAPGMACAAAARLLARTPLPDGPCPDIREGREEITLPRAKRRLILVDSAGLVRPDDAGQVVVTGSHGAIFGGNPANALKTDAHLALFNDAGGAATSRLPALQDRGVAAATVAATSARIGDAHSTWHDGTISALNPAAETIGGRIGMKASDLVASALRS